MPIGMVSPRLLVGRALLSPEATPLVSAIDIARSKVVRFCHPDSSHLAPSSARHRSPSVIAFCYRFLLYRVESVARWRALLHGATAPYPDTAAKSVARWRALLHGATAPYPARIPYNTQSPAQSLRARFVSARARSLPSRPLALSPAASLLFAAGSPYGSRFCRRAVCFAVRFAPPPLPLRSQARAPSCPLLAKARWGERLRPKGRAFFVGWRTDKARRGATASPCWCTQRTGSLCSPVCAVDTNGFACARMGASASPCWCTQRTGSLCSPVCAVDTNGFACARREDTPLPLFSQPADSPYRDETAGWQGAGRAEGAGYRQPLMFAGARAARTPLYAPVLIIVPESRSFASVPCVTRSRWSRATHDTSCLVRLSSAR